jgi:hypothetical protein
MPVVKDWKRPEITQSDLETDIIPESECRRLVQNIAPDISPEKLDFLSGQVGFAARLYLYGQANMYAALCPEREV